MRVWWRLALRLRACAVARPYAFAPPSRVRCVALQVLTVHTAHAADFVCALIYVAMCHLVMPHARVFAWSWVAAVVAVNVGIEVRAAVVLVGRGNGKRYALHGSGLARCGCRTRARSIV